VNAIRNFLSSHYRFISQQFADLGLNKSSDRRQSQDNKSSKGNIKVLSG